jgi:STE24 endopeptidase
VLALLVLVFLVASPWIVSLLRTTGKPTGASAERVADLRERAGLDVRPVRVLDTEAEATASLYVRGPPGYRQLFVTSTFPDPFDDVAVALLAVQAGRVGSRVPAARRGTVVLAAVPLVESVTGAAPRWPALAATFGVVVGFWLSCRGVRAADDYAAERIGPGTLADAIARYAEVHALEPTRRRVPNPPSVNVPLGDRIDRLSERSSGCRSESPHSAAS